MHPQSFCSHTHTHTSGFAMTALESREKNTIHIVDMFSQFFLKEQNTILRCIFSSLINNERNNAPTKRENLIFRVQLG